MVVEAGEGGMSHFVNYALHYVILRTLYTAARGVGVSPWTLVGGASGVLVLLWLVGRGGRSGGCSQGAGV